ncbi:MAG: arginine--tRNA ligase [Candidatus Diapherotrites archaeon]|nr:arginine--tRNA ligase [Candidatus Diapherotrites archaeon]
MDFREMVVEALHAVLKDLSGERIAEMIEVPKQANLGDYALPCYRLSGIMKKAPQDIAKELKEKIALPKGISRAEVIGAYLNFFVANEALAKDVIKRILAEKQDYGKSDLLKGKRIMVEYSGPNTNKTLHLGHLRNQALGMAIANLYGANGARAIKANIYSDRGAHICKSMLAYEKFGGKKTPQGAHIKPDKFVMDYYVRYTTEAEKNPELEKEVQEMLKKWEAGDKKTIALWKKMNGWALQGIRQTYKEFGSRFDVEFYESKFYDKAQPVIELGLKKGVFEKDESGAIIAKLASSGMPDKVVMRADGTSIYITNDLALTKHKFEKYRLDEALWVVGNEHSLYFRQLFRIFELLGFSWAKKCRHMSYGLVNLPEGKMKSREGTVVEADDIIREMQGLAMAELQKRYPEMKKQELQKRTRAISLAAIKFFMLKVDAGRDFLFNPKESISFEGETGPFVQYSYARACSILRKAGKKAGAEIKNANPEALESEIEKKLIALLDAYPKTLQNCISNMSLHPLCQHLLELSSAFNLFYHEMPVLRAETKELRAARLALVKAAKIVIASALSVLDIEPIEEM